MKDIHTDTIGKSEDALQQKCYFWFWNEFPHLRGLLFSVPNGGLRNKREAVRLSKTGLYSGVSDLILLYRTQAYLIELKVEGRKLFKNQRNWKEIVEHQGFNYFIVNSLHDFRRLITQLVVV